jgi:hypothetical protein
MKTIKDQANEDYFHWLGFGSHNAWHHILQNRNIFKNAKRYSANSDIVQITRPTKIYNKPFFIDLYVGHPKIMRIAIRYNNVIVTQAIIKFDAISFTVEGNLLSFQNELKEFFKDLLAEINIFNWDNKFKHYTDDKI